MKKRLHQISISYFYDKCFDQCLILLPISFAQLTHSYHFIPLLLILRHAHALCTSVEYMDYDLLASFDPALNFENSDLMVYTVHQKSKGTV